MKSDFKKMEDEMDLLATNMDSITSFSEQISGTLQVNIYEEPIFCELVNFEFSLA